MKSAEDMQAQQERADLARGLPTGIRFNPESMFPKLKGWGVEKANKRRMALAQQIAPVLQAALGPNETVEWLAPGIVNLWWEHAFMGMWAYLVNRTLIVLTSERFLLIHMDGKNPHSFVNQVPRASVKSIGTFASLRLNLGKGNITFSTVKGDDKKQLKDLLSPNPQATGGLEYLCSSCYVMHPEHVERCDQCGAKFKSPAHAAMRSLILPGLGDYYLGHRMLAILEMMGSVLTWAIALILIVTSAKDDTLAVGLILAMLLVGFANVSDALLTRAQARKGLMAEDGHLGTGAPKSAIPMARIV